MADSHWPAALPLTWLYVALSVILFIHQRSLLWLITLSGEWLTVEGVTPSSSSFQDHTAAASIPFLVILLRSTLSHTFTHFLPLHLWYFCGVFVPQVCCHSSQRSLKFEEFLELFHLSGNKAQHAGGTEESTFKPFHTKVYKRAFLFISSSIKKKW